MTAPDLNDGLVRALAGDLAPVHRLLPPALRVLAWLAIVAAIGIELAAICDLKTLARSFIAAPDLCLAAAGSMLTAVLGAAAAFQLCLPDRSPVWALLPVPAAVLWIGASGIGCLRSWTVAASDPLPLGGPGACLLFILGLSVPLSIFLIIMLRPGYSFRPNLTSTVCGLACAAAAATLLNFVHSHDANAADLAVHAIAVAAVIASNRLFGSRILTAENFRFHRNNGSVRYEPDT